MVYNDIIFWLITRLDFWFFNQHGKFFNPNLDYSNIASQALFIYHSVSDQLNTASSICPGFIFDPQTNELFPLSNSNDSNLDYLDVSVIIDDALNTGNNNIINILFLVNILSN